MADAPGVNELPDDLQRLLKVVVGMEWPEGSEALLRQMYDYWHTFHDELDAVRDEVTGVARDLGTVMEGSAATAYIDLLSKDLPGYLDLLAEGADELAKASMNAAADIQKAKVMIIVQLVVLAASIAFLLA